MRCNYISMPLTKLLGDSVCTPGQLQMRWTWRRWLMARRYACREIPELAASEMMVMFWGERYDEIRDPWTVDVFEYVSAYLRWWQCSRDNRMIKSETHGLLMFLNTFPLIWDDGNVLGITVWPNQRPMDCWCFWIRFCLSEMMAMF